MAGGYPHVARIPGGEAVLLFTGRFNGYYDVARDGRFLMLKGMEQDLGADTVQSGAELAEDLQQKVGRK